AAQVRVEQIFEDGRRLLDEIRLDEMRAGLDRRAELKGVESLLRPLFPAQLCALRPADDRRPHPRLIEADVELLRFRGERDDAAVGAALLQPQLEQYSPATGNS